MNETRWFVSGRFEGEIHLIAKQRAHKPNDLLLLSHNNSCKNTTFYNRWTSLTVISYLEASTSYRLFHVPRSRCISWELSSLSRKSVTFDLETQSSSKDSRWKWRSLKLSREGDSLETKVSNTQIHSLKSRV